MKFIHKTLFQFKVERATGIEYENVAASTMAEALEVYQQRSRHVVHAITSRGFVNVVIK